MTTTTMKITEARQKFTGFPKMFAQGTGVGAIEVESHGRPVLAVLSWETYESLLETLEIMSDPELMSSLRKSIREASSGKTRSWSSVKAKLSP